MERINKMRVCLSMAGQFEQTLNEFEHDMKGSQVSIKQMLVVLNNRGFGALLLIPCIIELLPTGAIPGVPTICATLIILLSLQILLGKRHPWVPKKIQNRTFEYKKLKSGLNKSRPYIKWIDRQTRARWKFLASHSAERLASLSIITLALTIYPLELVPFASSIPSFIIALYAIGFLTKDGLLLMITWILALGGGIGIGYLIKSFLI